MRRFIARRRLLSLPPCFAHSHVAAEFRRSQEILEGAQHHLIEDLKLRLEQHMAEGVLPLSWALRTLMMNLMEAKRTREALTFWKSMYQFHEEQLTKMVGRAAAGDTARRLAALQPVVESLIDSLPVHGDPFEAIDVAQSLKRPIEDHLKRATLGFAMFGSLEMKPEVHGRIAVIDQQMLGNVPFGTMTRHYDAVVIPFSAIRFIARLPDGPEKSGASQRVRMMLNTINPQTGSVFVRTLPYIQQIRANCELPFLDSPKVVPSEEDGRVGRFVIASVPKPEGGAVPSPKKSSKRYSPAIQGNHIASAALHLSKQNQHTEFHIVSTSAHILYHAQINRICAVDFPSELPIKAPVKRGEGTPGEPQTEPDRRGSRANLSGDFKSAMTKPNHQVPLMRILVDPSADALGVEVESRDVLLTPNVFNRPGDETIYDRLVAEVTAAEQTTQAGAKRRESELLVYRWHFNTHSVVDDDLDWKKHCPTFVEVLDRIKQFFGVKVFKTRFNWYKNTKDWKPLHHDAAAVKMDKTHQENITIGVTFGATREAIFEEVKSKRVVSFALDNGSVYSFSRDVNVMWKHGIRQEQELREEGRISIIIWGWIKQAEADDYV